MGQIRQRREASGHPEGGGNELPVARRNRELRFRQIIDAARLTFQDDGYASFSTRRVAERVGITLGNLQYYFRTRDELLRAALHAYLARRMEDYTAISVRVGMNAARRCAALIDRIFSDITETDLPKFMVQMWAFAQRDPDASALLEAMYSTYCGIFDALLAEMHPDATEDERQVRSLTVVAQMESMAIVYSHGGYSERDLAEFARATKRTVRMIVSRAGPTRQDYMSSAFRHDGRASGASQQRGDGGGASAPGSSGTLALRMPTPSQDALYYRPTEQGKRRELKINEIVSTAATVLATEGYASFSLARVAKELGILLSALRNYFPTHDDLLRATIEALANSYLDRYEEMGRPSASSALERLCEIAADALEQGLDLRAYRLLIELYALAQHSDVALELARSGYSAYRAIFANLLREIDPSATARDCVARATLIAAQMDGVAILLSSLPKQAAAPDRVFEFVMAVTVSVARGETASDGA
ncbi:TetR/AcrR family transcriptional regulator [Burkholderia multivorans]|uniref:TetR/AcrR family transcriptional regulator n=1 Tax=Burkholderia multivorans TaxID=87883 RepID=UPI00075DF0EC|nr:TetR/AcrR family transcriptional regulator [Burkholderia multivorans]KWF66517.1 TetR family transcriptional regulator [Burkholderia multivorans]KWF73081.1 TetR family transcriptional regulator [Burkholderia multivorans]MBU9163864.1 TetR/AcrR family transcriptional regulator [Burkholderia multivorans]MBU9491528.1 TetR/AcrR family transcriptional regulator [Burkholderia multivorans]